jgi:UDP-3-O-[3-hydroxymyristoyl] glucosamine N-acyltransferase
MMVPWKELVQIDQTLVLQYSKQGQSLDEILVSTLSHFDRLQPHSVIFIKNEKFLQKFEEVYQAHTSFSSLEIGVIFEQSFWEKIQKKEKSRLDSFLKDLSFLALSPSVMLTMCRLSEVFYKKEIQSINSFVDGRQMGTARIHPTALIAQGVFIGENVTIGPHVIIHSGVSLLGHNEIGEGTHLFANVTLYPRVKLGKNCRLHSHAVIGADGFGYHFEKGVHHKIWHLGGVEIGDDVEVGANSAIDGGTFSPTIIGPQCKIDNLVQIGHNCHLGQGVILCGHVAIGGSSHIGDYSVFGGKSGMGQDMKIGKACQIAGGALVNCDWPDGSILGGHPARPLKEWMKGLALVSNLVQNRHRSSDKNS